MDSKYISVFKISFSQEFAYRMNFVMWRVRNVLGIFLIFYLWDAVFSESDQELFGYDRDRILTYVFGVFILRALIMSTRAVDIAGEISRGDVMNYLVKPVNYFKYWFARDLSSKALNIIFAFFETLFLFILLKPPFYVQTNILILLLFLVTVCLATLIFFYLVLLVDMIAFWVPEAGWAGQYLFIGIFATFLSGSVFPIDILPQSIQKIIYLTPFPYLIFYPIQVYLGKLTPGALLVGLLVSVLWVAILALGVGSVWSKGLKHYVAFGR